MAIKQAQIEELRRQFEVNQCVCYMDLFRVVFNLEATSRAATIKKPSCYREIQGRYYFRRSAATGIHT